MLFVLFIISITAITIDFDTLDDQGVYYHQVTVRDRDTTQQKRVHIDQLHHVLLDNYAYFL